MSFSTRLGALLVGAVGLSAADLVGQSSVLDFEGVLTLDYSSVVDGGVAQRGGWLGNLDLVATLEGSRIGWQGGSATLYVLSNAGDAPSAWAGDLQGTNNIEAPEAVRLFEAFVEQELLDGSLRILAGLRDLNADFHVVESGALFLNSSHGIGVEFSQTGANGPSIFPNSALTLRASMTPREGLGLRFAVIDAVANDPERPQDTRIRVGRDEGALLTSEIELFDAADAAAWRAVLGAWNYTRAVPDLRARASDGTSVATTGDRGLYGIVEGRLASVGDEVQIDGFARLGFANGDAYMIARGWGAGLVASGLLGRPDDSFGIALAVADGRSFDGIGFTETLVEATYDWVIDEHLEFRGDMQWVDQIDLPGSPDNALVVTLRTTLVF